MNVLGLVSRESLEFLAFLTVELTAIYLAVVLLVEVLQTKLGTDRLQELVGADVGPSRFLVAAGLGAVTPFCSCSTVPVVAGMKRAGVPWPVLSSFLIISPLVNPALFALMWGLVSVEYALLYVAGSLLVAVFVGVVIHHAGWDETAADVAHRACATDAATPSGEGCEDEAPSLRDDAVEGWGWGPAWREAWTSTLRLAPVFLAAGLIGTALKFWVGTAWVQAILAGTGWWGIPVAALVGIPVYASTAVLLPLGALLLQQGVNLGIVTAFLMGATGFSVPEGMMLKEIIGGRRLATIGAAFSVAVVAAGYAFQLVPN
jgi:uncharacterized membrane protein YraQ (UPF0718 family)